MPPFGLLKNSNLYEPIAISGRGDVTCLSCAEVSAAPRSLSDLRRRAMEAEPDRPSERRSQMKEGQPRYVSSTYFEAIAGRPAKY